MTFYNRNGVLYARINGQRISTKLKDTKENRKLFESYAKNDEFFEKFDVKEKSIPTVIELCEEVMIERKKKLLNQILYILIYVFLTNALFLFLEKRKLMK